MASISFDEQFYLSQNPDVAAAVSRGEFKSGLEHYQTNGRFEGRDPNAYFDTSFYLGEYPDVARSGINPFDHFLANGAAEGRAPNGNLDGSLDLNNNGSIADDFDATAYLAANPDVAAAGVNPLQHFLTFGQFEGRSAPLNNGTSVSGPFATGATGGNSGSGTTITLSQNLDGPGAASPAVNTNGTSGNDTYLADNVTLSADSINGAGGTDTLRVVSNGNGTYAPSLTSVERVESSVLNGGTAVFDLTNATGVQTLAATSGNGFTQFNGVNAIVSVENGAVTAGGVQVQYQDSVIAGASDIQKVSFNNSQTGGLFVNGIETIQVTSTGTNTVGQLASSALSSVTFSGAGSIDIIGTLIGASTVNASAATGSVSVVLDTTKDVTVTGGSGNDSFDFTSGLTTGDKIDGGAGTDTVRSTISGDLTAAAATAPFTALVNVEKVAFDGTSVTLNGSTFTNSAITNIEFNTTGADTVNNAGSARTYEFGVDNTGSATFALASGVTSLKLAHLGTDPSAIVSNDGQDADVAGITITTAGVESTTTPVTVALTSQGDLADGFFTTGTFDEGQFNQTGLITVASGSTFTIDGSGNLAIFGGTPGALTEGFDNNITLNTSAVTGNTVLVGSSFDTGAIGTAAVAGIDANNDGDFADAGDTPPVTGVNTPTGEGVDTFTLGVGKDIVVFRDGLASGIVQIATPAGGTTAANAAPNGNILVDTINNFTAGANGDVLFHGTNLANTAPTSGDYTAILAATQTAINALSGANATLLNAANAAAADASGGWTAFTFQGDTYALFDANNGGGTYENGVDTLVKLAGVNIASLTDANFEA